MMKSLSEEDISRRRGHESYQREERETERNNEEEGVAL